MFEVYWGRFARVERFAFSTAGELGDEAAVQARSYLLQAGGNLA